MASTASLSCIVKSSMPRPRPFVLLSAWLACLSVAAASAAQPGETGRTAGGQAPVRRPPDFLFGRPAMKIGLRALWRQAPRASDVLDVATELLTLDRNALAGAGFIADVGFPLAGRLDGVVGFEYSRASALSEDREYVDEGGLPIEQVTTLGQAHLSAGVELALLPRGRAIGQYVWIPRRVAPYVGAGGGLLRYTFRQEGDFVDYTDLAIITEQYVTSGWTPGAHVLGGVDVQVTRRLAVSAEARYVWARTTARDSFAGVGDVDLTGLRIAGGVQFAF